MTRSILALFLCVGAASGQVFDSTSTGADGALSFPAAAGVIVWDPATAGPGGTPLDPENDNIFHFTTIDVPAGTTVKLIAPNFGGEGRPVVWLASGAVTIAGTIDLDGGDGHAFTTGVGAPSIAGAGGWSGGTYSPGITRPGNGPGGGLLGDGGSHRRLGNGSPPGRTYGNRFLLPLTGGSGGSASINTSGGGPFSGGGGGAGGGALLLASSVSVDLTGAITARGGGGNEGGAGGGIRVVAPLVSGSGSIDVGGFPGSSNVFGGSGYARIQAFENTFFGAGTVSPADSLTVATPGLLFPPVTAATVRIAAVDGVPSPANPTGSFAPVDVTISNPATVVIDVEATNVPPGTTVRLVIVSEDGASQNLISSPLVGTLAASTATVNAVLPSGFSRITLSASWTP